MKLIFETDLSWSFLKSDKFILEILLY